MLGCGLGLKDLGVSSQTELLKIPELLGVDVGVIVAFSSASDDKLNSRLWMLAATCVIPLLPVIIYRLAFCSNAVF